MIYLITGVPGSGKSLYAVSTLVQQLMKETIKAKDGKEIARRLCVDGIPDLLLPHELLATPPEHDTVALAKGKDAEPSKPEGNGVWNWYEWAKPGDLIVIDEAQRYWRPRGMGTKPPKEIQMLETHRHYGVDFIIITQNAMLIDQNVRRLVGRHQHVRRLFGMNRALVYDWDGCQADTGRVGTASKTMFGYPKSAYALYKSSELHTKQKQKIPVWLALPVLALVGLIAIGPKAYSALAGSVTGKGVTASKVDPNTGTKVAQAPDPAATASKPAAAASAPETQSQSTPTEPPQKPVVVAGCAVMRGKCSCFDPQGQKVETQPEMCMEGLPPKTGIELSQVPVIAKFEDDRKRKQPADPAMLELIADSNRYAKQRGTY
jgi:zona occludens toxin